MQLKHAIQAYLASSFILTLAAHDANIILGPLLSAAFKTSEDRSPSSVRRSPDDDLRAIWNAFLKVPRLHTPSIFGLLLDISVQRGDRALVVEIWESGKDVNNLLKQMASPVRVLSCLRRLQSRTLSEQSSCSFSIVYRLSSVNQSALRSLTRPSTPHSPKRHRYQALAGCSSRNLHRIQPLLPLLLIFRHCRDRLHHPPRPTSRLRGNSTPLGQSTALPASGRGRNRIKR